MTEPLAALDSLVLERPAAAPRDALLAVAGARADRAVRVPTSAAPDDLAALDRLVALTRGHLDAATRVHLLRSAGLAHLAVADPLPLPGPTSGPSPGPTSTPTSGPGPAPAVAHVDELVAAVTEHDLTLFRADAQVLLARRALLGRDQEAALAAVTTALAHLDEPVLTDGAPTAAEHRVNLRRSLRLVTGVLVSLGMHELAHEALRRARATVDPDDPGAEALARCDVAQVRVDTSWGLRRQRAGHDGSAPLRAAAATARRLAAGPPTRTGASHAALLDAAVALARDPAAGVPHPPGLAPSGLAPSGLAPSGLGGVPGAASMHDHLVARLARARVLIGLGADAEAVAVLSDVLAAPPRGEPDLLLSVQRELAQHGPRRPGVGTGTPTAYADGLEAELWSLREARAVSLRTRVAHEKLRREHGEVTAAAFTDPLTGLPNRRSLDATLSRLLGRGPAGGPPRGQVSVAVVDVDRFKLVNDRLTHAAGDEVLRTVAGILARSLRTGDVVARFGGDEFVAVLPGCGAEDAAAAMHRAARETASTAIGDGTSVSLSVGIAEMFPDPGALAPVALPGPDHPARHGLAGHEVLVRADAVMYAAKRAGGDAVWVERGCRPPAGARP